jgi:flagellar biosynthesis protein FlhG
MTVERTKTVKPAQEFLFGGNGGNGSNGGAQPQVWAIGGGKGGTGKTFLASSLGISLAGRGKKVILLDADLGGANLHTFLGIRRPENSLTDFFERKVPLSKLVVETGVDGLGLITGDVHTLDSDSVKYTQKMKLYRHIRELDAHYVIIDLGAGSHANTLDMFLFADRMVVTIVPVKTSIENMYHFVKSVFFRKLKHAFGKSGMQDAVLNAWKNRKTYGITNLRELLDYLRESHPHMRSFFEHELGNFTIHVVLNQLKSTRDVNMGNSVKSVFRKYLSAGSKFSGYVEYDESILRCINMGKPYMKVYPMSHCSREIEKLTDNMLAGHEVGFIA